jgi:hypothetical protein
MWVSLCIALSTVGCDRGPSVEEVRARAEKTAADAEATAKALSTGWVKLVADVKASAIVPDLAAPCAAQPRPAPAWRNLAAMTTGVSSMAAESVLDRRFPAGSYYVAPSQEIDESYSPTAAKLKRVTRDLRASLENPEAKPEELSSAVREIQRVKSRYEGLILIDEVEAPRITDRTKSLFQPGYAIGRAYLFDHETGKVVCFASVTAGNKPKVKASAGLDRAFLEMDLAKAVFKTVDERWVAARKR